MLREPGKLRKLGKLRTLGMLRKQEEMRKLRNLINETEAHQPLLIPCIILKDLEHCSYQKCLELLFNISQKKKKKKSIC
jgi:hypothetical protein